MAPSLGGDGSGVGTAKAKPRPQALAEFKPGRFYTWLVGSREDTHERGVWRSNSGWRPRPGGAGWALLRPGLGRGAGGQGFTPGCCLVNSSSFQLVLRCWESLTGGTPATGPNLHLSDLTPVRPYTCPPASRCPYGSRGQGGAPSTSHRNSQQVFIRSCSPEVTLSFHH